MKNLLIVTALLELGAGLALIALPSTVVKLLLGSGLDSSAAMTLGRLTGVALFALSIACWLARGEITSRATRGLTAAMFFYNVAAVVILGLAGLNAKPVGIALWPAVIVHVGMAIWCLICLRRNSPDKLIGTPRMTNG